MKNLAKYPKALCHRAAALLLAFMMAAAVLLGTGVTVNAEGEGATAPAVMTFSYAYDVQRHPDYPKKGEEIRAYSFNMPVHTSRDDRIESSGSWTLTKVGTYSTIKDRTDNPNSTNLAGIVNSIALNYDGIIKDRIVIHELKKDGAHIAYGVTLAYDSINNLAVFLGDPLGGGAGYLLSGTPQSNEVYITANMDVYDWITSAHTHTYGNAYITDDDYHWKECTDLDCPDKSDSVIDKAKHSSTGNNVATCQNKAVCDVCGAEYGEALGHTLSDWKYNDDNHWKECTVDGCDFKSELDEHEFKWVIDKEATATEKGAKHQECKTCGYKLASVEIPAKPSTPTKNTPKTGDHSNMMLWLTLLLASIVGLAGTAVYKKRNNYSR